MLIRSDRTNPVKIYIAPKAKLLFGDKVFLNNGINISCSNQIEIGTHVDIADECMIIDNDFHGVGNKTTKSKPIIIEDDVWIASRVIILKGVRIGRGSVVGAGAVVTKNQFHLIHLLQVIHARVIDRLNKNTTKVNKIVKIFLKIL